VITYDNNSKAVCVGCKLVELKHFWHRCGGVKSFDFSNNVKTHK